MKIKVKYFAALREKAGLSEELLETTKQTAAGLLEELNSKYDFNLAQKNLKVAINEEYAPFSTHLKENDIVVFIPPVAGG